MLIRSATRRSREPLKDQLYCMEALVMTKFVGRVFSAVRLPAATGVDLYAVLEVRRRVVCGCGNHRFSSLSRSRASTNETAL